MNQTTTVSVSTADVNEDANSVTFTIQTSNAPDAGESATATVTVNGVEQTVALDASGKGTLTIDTQDSDVYNDSQSYEVVVTAINGGNFENVSVDGASATANVTDTENETKITLTASASVNEDSNPEGDGFTAGNDITYTASLPDGVVAKNNIDVTLSVGANGEPSSSTNPALVVTIIAGQSSGTVKATEVNRDNDDISGNNDSTISEDVYKETDSLSASIVSAIEVDSDGEAIVSETEDTFENLTFDDTAAVTTIVDDIDPVNITIDAIATTPKVIDITTATDGTTGVTVTAYGTDGKVTDLSVISGTNHDGFGVQSENHSNGATKELGLDEKIVVEFDNDVNSLDVSYAWRNNHETSLVTFYNDGIVVGSATVDGDGSSTTKAYVKYYDASGDVIKEVEARGSSDKVDEAFTFELPDSSGNIIAFDKVEFTAPEHVDDYLIHEIVYTEVVDSSITDIVTSDGSLTFTIQMDEDYPPKSDATAKVEIGGKEYDVELNATGRGTLTLDADDIAALGDLSNITVEVTEVVGGGYEKVNPASETFDFAADPLTGSDDTISTDEDISYTLTENDFGDYTATETTEFKITELPTNGTLYLNVTSGDTIINKDGTETIATLDSKTPISADDIISLANVAAGKVEFEPTTDTDEDGSFKFKVGDGDDNFSEEYTTTIEVIAVADTPDADIDVTKNSESTSGASVTIDGDTSINNIGTTQGDRIEINKELVMNDKIDLQEGNDTLILNEKINQVTLDLGEGDDTVVINKEINGTNNVHLGSGDDVIEINDIVTNNTHILGNEGKDTLYLNGNQSDYTFNWQTNNNDMIEGSITDKIGGGTIQYNQMETIVFGDGSYIGTTPEVSTVEYEVDFSAALADTDGSETLTVQISGAPANAIFNTDALVYNATDKVWELTIGTDSEGNALTEIDYDNIKMIVPKNTENVELTITARVTETNDNENDLNFEETISSDAIIPSTDEIVLDESVEENEILEQNTDDIFTETSQSSPITTNFNDDTKYNLNYEGETTGDIFLKGITNSVDIDIKSYKDSKDEGRIFLKKDGEIVETIELDEATTGDDNESHTFTVESNYDFDTIEIINDSSKEFKIEGVNAEITITDGFVINSLKDTWTDNETIDGTDGSDTINIGNGSNKIINAGDGDDIINTPSSFWKGTGQIINGEDGNDTLIIDHVKDDGTTRFDIIDNANGTHTIKAITYNEWSEWDAGYEITVNSVENIQFDDGIVSLASIDNTKTATLIDGIVEGVEYETSSGIIGLTDSNGDFNYKEGDSVTFSVGSVVLGVVTAQELVDGQVFLQDIANVNITDLNNEYLENLATFLQSIDSDAGDNIVITQETRDLLVDSYLNLQTASEVDVKVFVESIGKTFVDEESAMDHVQGMLEEYAGIDASEFEEHTDDSIKSGTFGIDGISEVLYTTSSGIEGQTDENGEFTYDIDDIISFKNIAGEVIAQLNSNDIGDDKSITLSELGITINDVLDSQIKTEETELNLSDLNFGIESTSINFNNVSEIAKEETIENENGKSSENIDNPLEILNTIPGTEELAEEKSTSLSDNFIQTDGNAQTIDSTVQVKVEQPISDGITS